MSRVTSPIALRHRSKIARGVALGAAVALTLTACGGDEASPEESVDEPVDVAAEDGGGDDGSGDDAGEQQVTERQVDVFAAEFPEAPVAEVSATISLAGYNDKLPYSDDFSQVVFWSSGAAGFSSEESEPRATVVDLPEGTETEVSLADLGTIQNVAVQGETLYVLHENGFEASISQVDIASGAVQADTASFNVDDTSCGYGSTIEVIGTTVYLSSGSFDEEPESVCSVDLATGETQSLTLSTAIAHVEMSPDGQSIAVISDTDSEDAAASVLDVSDGQITLAVDEEPVPYSARNKMWALNGGGYAYQSQPEDATSNSATQLEFSDGRDPLVTFIDNLTPANGDVWGAHTNQLSDSSVYLLDTTTGDIVATLEGDGFIDRVIDDLGIAVQTHVNDDGDTSEVRIVTLP